MDYYSWHNTNGKTGVNNCVNTLQYNTETDHRGKEKPCFPKVMKK